MYMQKDEVFILKMKIEGRPCRREESNIHEGD